MITFQRIYAHRTHITKWHESLNDFQARAGHMPIMTHKKYGATTTPIAVAFFICVKYEAESKSMLFVTSKQNSIGKWYLQRLKNI